MSTENPIHTPRERSVAWVAAVVGTAVILWVAFGFFFDSDHELRWPSLAAAGTASICAFLAINWYWLRKDCAVEHAAILEQLHTAQDSRNSLRQEITQARAELATGRSELEEARAELVEMRDDNRRIIALLEQVASRYDWNAFADGLESAAGATSSMPTPIPIHRNRPSHTE